MTARASTRHGTLAAGLSAPALLGSGCGDSTARATYSVNQNDQSINVDETLPKTRPVTVDGPLGETARYRDLRVAVLSVDDGVAPDSPGRRRLFEPELPSARFVRVEVPRDAQQINLDETWPKTRPVTIDGPLGRTTRFSERVTDDEGSAPSQTETTDLGVTVLSVEDGVSPDNENFGRLTLRRRRSATGYVAAQLPNGRQLKAIELRGDRAGELFTWGVS